MEELQFILNDDGVFEEYSDKYDITIHCESEEEQKAVMKALITAGIFSDEESEGES